MEFDPIEVSEFCDLGGSHNPEEQRDLVFSHWRYNISSYRRKLNQLRWVKLILEIISWVTFVISLTYTFFKENLWQEQSSQVPDKKY